MGRKMKKEVEIEKEIQKEVQELRKIVASLVVAINDYKLEGLEKWAREFQKWGDRHGDSL